ncbi:MAG: hypothetical protein K9L70_14405 [Thiohalocapsa sp.]|nr:hypothetical protein [Thiohalocapsa sp.]MCF7991485.1 hypothetical protein [Thiohalocapsa sp.]
MQAQSRLLAVIALAAAGIVCSATAAAQAASAAPGLPAAIGERTVEQLRGVLVEDRGGAVIGRVADVLRDRNGDLVALVGSGELDADAGGAVFPLSGFDTADDRLVAPTDRAAAAVPTAAALDSDRFEPVPSDIALSRLTSGSRLQEVAEQSEPLRPFSDLDLDHDGVLSSTEALGSPRIGTDWVELDVNNDGVLDRSEVSVLYGDAPPTAEEASR